MKDQGSLISQSDRALLFGPRTFRKLLLGYGLFILYGTFIPFRFSTDPAFINAQWARFLMPLFIDGARQFSILDVVSNVLLFIPFGFLWIGGEKKRASLARASGNVARITAWALVAGLLIEIGQIYSPGRTASLLDTFCNGAGALIGAILGVIFFSRIYARLDRAVTAIVLTQPSILLLIVLMAGPVADAFYPFQITLDVSTVWENIKRIDWRPFYPGLHRFWADLLLEKVILFAVIGYVALLSLRRSSPAPFLHAVCLSIGLAFSIEAGKLLFVGRVPNLENFLLASFGALIGAAIIPPVAAGAFFQRHSAGVIIAFISGVVVYSELTPFDWVSSRSALEAKLASIEWLPLSAYYRADPQSAIYDLGKKLFIIAPAGFVIAARLGLGPLAVSLLGLCSGLLLESCQLALISRTPSTTDVILFGVAAWVGAALFGWFSNFMRNQSLDLPGSGSR